MVRVLLVAVVLLAILAYAQAGNRYGIGKKKPAKAVAKTDVNLVAERDLVEQYEGLHKRMMVISRDEVAEVVNSVAETRGVNPDHLAALLLRASQWGDLQSFSRMASLMNEKGVSALTDGMGATLADSLYYVLIKKMVKDVDGCIDHLGRLIKVFESAIHLTKNNKSVETSVVPKPGQGILIDHVVLERLKHIKSFNDHVTSNLDKYTFIIPSGFIGGVSMLNQHKLSDVTDQLAATLAKKCSKQAGSLKESTECGVREALQMPVVKELLAALPGLDEEQIVWLDGDQVPTKSQMQTMDVLAAKIASNLAPQIPPYETYADVVRPLMEKCDTKDAKEANYAANVLDYFSRTLSMSNLAEYSRNIYKQALDAGFVTNALKIHSKEKSAALVNLMYIVNNDLSLATKVVRVGEDSEDPTTTLILDDCAMKGSQMSVFLRTKDDVPDPNSPSIGILVATNSPSHNAVLVSKKKDKTGKKVFVGELVPVGEFGPGLDEKRPRWDAFTTSITDLAWGHWGDLYTFVTFPYMAPDNNVFFFASYVAPLFTFKGCGVKARAPVSYDTSFTTCPP